MVSHRLRTEKALPSEDGECRYAGGPRGCQLLLDELDRKPGAGDHRLTHHDRRIGRNWQCVHRAIPRNARSAILRPAGDSWEAEDADGWGVHAEVGHDLLRVFKNCAPFDPAWASRIAT
jgi:hypothetical protein